MIGGTLFFFLFFFFFFFFSSASSFFGSSLSIALARRLCCLPTVDWLASLSLNPLWRLQLDFY
ncbi:hypothetical protein ACMBCN_02305, partial [Candidatus Liberibacter asiaticus]